MPADMHETHLQVELQAGPVAVSACSYSIHGAAVHSVARLMAGQRLQLSVETRDQYGNLAQVPPSCLGAQASGPLGAFSFTALQATPKQRRQELEATLTGAGSYGLSVFVVDPDTRVRMY